jgi:hypothetical protein
MLTNRITVRGQEFEVRELTGKEMQGVRKLLADPLHKSRFEAYIASVACVSPKIADEKAAAEMPQIIIDKIAAEAIRLTVTDESGGDAAKND